MILVIDLQVSTEVLSLIILVVIMVLSYIFAKRFTNDANIIFFLMPIIATILFSAELIDVGALVISYMIAVVFIYMQIHNRNEGIDNGI